jgi:hypothetical protein
MTQIYFLLHKPENLTDLLENHFGGQKRCEQRDPD